MKDKPDIPRCQLTISNPEVFLDLRSRGFHDVIGGIWMEGEGGELTFRFPHSVISDYVEDDWLGTHHYTTVSQDDGRTWSDPVLVRLDGVQDFKQESSGFGPIFRTAQGTVLHYGIHQTGSGYRQRDLQLRDYMNLYARQEAGQSHIEVTPWPPGTFMREQFLEGGLQLPTGRIVFTMWGVAEPGENWRSGVLLSDDDGKSWRFRTVAYEPDPGIRDRTDKDSYPAGFNEQTLFYTQDGKLISIIRGREGLGRGVPGGGNLDTWFFRSESDDDGETWTKPTLTNLPGTGATIGKGITLPDTSLLIGCRVPYSRDYYDLPDKELFGLHLARSFDEGHTWTTEAILQHDPDGLGMNTHHCAMNGSFRMISADSYDYIFGFFGHAYEPKIQRMLKVRITVT